MGLLVSAILYVGHCLLELFDGEVPMQGMAVSFLSLSFLFQGGGTLNAIYCYNILTSPLSHMSHSLRIMFRPGADAGCTVDLAAPC